MPKAIEDFNVYDRKREGVDHEREPSLEPVNDNGDSSLFSFSLDSEELIKKDNYVLSVAGFFTDSVVKIAASLSNYQTAVYDISRDNIAKVSVSSAHTKTITSTRFSIDRDTHLFTSSLDGTLKLWDLRNPSQVGHSFGGGDVVRPITCFDISCDGRFLCAGTEVVGGSAFLLFWDIRSTKLLGGYWESHIEDLTQVRFHPVDKNRMVTGSMDGLINIFDVKRTREDNALIDSLNTEQSVDRLGWFPEGNSLYCLTHYSDLQIWKLTDSSPSLHFTKQQIASKTNIKYFDNLYTVDVHINNEGNSFLLAGSNLGSEECLRSISFNNSLMSATSLIGNKQIVRSSVYNPQHNLLVTGGENGILNVWRPDSDRKPLNNKIKNQAHKSKSQRMKPY